MMIVRIRHRRVYVLCGHNNNMWVLFVMEMKAIFKVKESKKSCGDSLQGHRRERGNYRLVRAYLLLLPLIPRAALHCQVEHHV